MGGGEWRRGIGCELREGIDTEGLAGIFSSGKEVMLPQALAQWSPCDDRRRENNVRLSAC